MNGKAYWKDILRSMTHGKKRFLSLAVIATLGVTMMCGLRASCVDLRYSADRFFDEQNLFDIRVQSTLGLTDEDIAALEAMDGVDAADGGYTETAYTKVEEMQKSIEIRTLSAKDFNQPYILEGRLPEKANEIAVTENYKTHTGKTVGDTIELSDRSEYLKNDTYTITGIIVDTLNVNSSEGSMGFRSVSSSDYAGYVTADAAENEVYSVVYLSLSGTKELNCYSDAYEEAVESVVSEINASIKASREKARYEEVYTDAMDEWLDGKAEADDKFAEADAEIADAQKEIEDAREELENGRRQIVSGWQSVIDGRQQLEDGKSELDAKKAEAESAFALAEAEIEDGYAQINAGKETLEATNQALQDAQEQIDTAQKTLDEQKSSAEAEIAAARQTLADKEAELSAAQAQYDAGVQQLSETKAALQPQIDELEKQLASPDLSPEQKTELESSLAQLNATISQAETTLAQTKQQIDEGNAALAAGRAQLDEKEAAVQKQFDDAQSAIDQSQAELNSGKEQYEAGVKELTESENKLNTGKAELEAQKEAAMAEIDAAYETISVSQAKLRNAENKLTANEAKIADGEEELADAERELSESIEEYEEEKAKAEKELADAKKEIDDIDMTKWYVQDRSSLSGYSNVKSDAASIQSLGGIFPVLFLIVAILISLTTVTRMVEEERGLIGTYKALGFSNREIRRKYTIYAASACLLGGIIGDIGGYIVIPAIIFVVFRVMYVLPDYAFQFDLIYGLGGILLFEAGIVGATVYTCSHTLQKMPAKLMRPKSPKSGSRVLLERIPFLWKRFTFLQKVTARNLFRYKKRFVMTVFGITGCMALLLCGFTIKNTVSELMPQQYEEIYKYDLMAVASDDSFDDLKETLSGDSEIKAYTSVRIDSVDVMNADGKKETVQLITVPKGESLESYICLKDRGGNVYSLQDGDVFLTRNASRILDFSSGDTILMRDIDLVEAEIPVSQIVENYLGNMAYMTESTYEQYFGEYEPNGVLALFSEECENQTEYTENLAKQDGILSAVSTEAMEDEFSSAFALMNMVVYVILVLAAMLAFVVLFTLSNTNISERVRELATIKVLGFYDFEVHSYVNKETWILTFIGIMLGMPAGYFFGQYLMGILELSSIEFYIVLYPQSYFMAAGITLVFAWIVKFITNRILDKINMVEALKSVE